MPAATGAVAAQVAQAGGGFLVQVLASRELGADGFAEFAFLYGSMIMATALTSGLIGDSLTVLDRHDPDVRAALRNLAALTVLLASAAAYLGAITLGALDGGTALLFATATATFMLADLARRVLMANLRFWHLVAIDGLGVLSALATIAVVTVLADRSGIGVFVVAIAAWQLAVILVAVLCFPASERAIGPLRRGALTVVLGFGAWRAAQQFVRPSMLNIARWLVLLAAGQAAVGELEAARIYVAPAMLLVQGVGGYLLASYAADQDRPTRVLLDRADRAARVMLLGSAAMAVVAAATVPVLGPIITAGAYDLSILAVVGWCVYAASCAAVLPYGTLAAVRRRQGSVLVLRLLDSALSISLVALAFWATSAGPGWAPVLLSVGSFAGGAACRMLLLRPLVVREGRSAGAGLAKTDLSGSHDSHTG